jgi:hypothetical protein
MKRARLSSIVGFSLAVCVALFPILAWAVEPPPASCTGTPVYKLAVQVSLDGGSSWLDNSGTLYLYPYSGRSIMARTLLTVTSGQTQGWSFSLEYDNSYQSYYGGSMSLTAVTTDGTQTATVQNGGPPDVDETAIRSGFKGYTQGIVIDTNQAYNLSPTSNFVTSLACFNITPSGNSGSYPVYIKYTHAVGSPKVRSVISQGGQSTVPCAQNFTLTVNVNPYQSSSGGCTIGGSGLMGGGDEGSSYEETSGDDGKTQDEGEGEQGLLDNGGEVQPGDPGYDFKRGDANGDNAVNISDPVFTLNYLFLEGTAPGCLDAADANDDESVDITDPIYLLGFLFASGAAPPHPGPFSCGPDLTDAGQPTEAPMHTLKCMSYNHCDQTDTDEDGLTDYYESRTVAQNDPDFGIYIPIGTDPNNSDTDNDSFLDGEEVLPTGVDGEIRISAIGADPLKPDIFVELDWFVLQTGNPELDHDHAPHPEAMATVVAAFAAAPINTIVNNVVVSSGIALHVDTGQLGGGNPIFFDDPDFETFIIPKRWGISGACLYCDWFNMYKRGTTFGNFSPGREKVFHYSLWCHHLYDGATFAGLSIDVPHEDFIMTLGSLENWDANANGCTHVDPQSLECDPDGIREVADLILIQGGTFMHELGHNLGLWHTGIGDVLPNGEEVHCKPNYVSVMNYLYAARGIDTNCDAVPDRATIDYSSSVLSDLDEDDLDETAGICGSPGIDWNGTNGLENSIAADINNDVGLNDGRKWCNKDNVRMILVGFNDWSFIQTSGMGAPRVITPNSWCSQWPTATCVGDPPPEPFQYCCPPITGGGGGGGSIEEELSPCLPSEEE